MIISCIEFLGIAAIGVIGCQMALDAYHHGMNQPLALSVGIVVLCGARLLCWMEVL